MAQDKESFILYCDIIHTIEKLPDDIAGKVFKHILEYVNDRDPIATDLVVSVCVEPIKQRLKRDLDKWEKSIDNMSTGGKIGNLKRWHKPIYKRYVRGDISLEDAVALSEGKGLSGTDTPDTPPIRDVSGDVGVIAVSVPVSVSVSDVNLKKAKKEIPTFEEVLQFVRTKSAWNENLEYSLREKYNSWVDNDWKDGNNSPIKNWKNKFGIIIPYLKVINNPVEPEKRVAGEMPRVDLRKAMFKEEGLNGR